MLTLQYVPQVELNSLTSTDKINKLLKIVKSEKIVLMEGRLKPNEETELIELTMEQISKSFKGVEICTIYPDKKENAQFFAKMKLLLVNMILGNRQGLTIIGPASIVKEIKRNPNKIELLTRSTRRRSKE
tara:strand:+ start:3529 stop:3918 length:390 start_codon:yes stop_codon:yes gene_type:complete